MFKMLVIFNQVGDDLLLLKKEYGDGEPKELITALKKIQGSCINVTDMTEEEIDIADEFQNKLVDENLMAFDRITPKELLTYKPDIIILTAIA